MVLSEIVPIWNVLGDKLDVEQILAVIAKFHSEPRKFIKLGKPEAPLMQRNNSRMGFYS